jgi:L-ascorbate metabolism protein UlaG (beta-lactamase superfamily)
LPDVIDYVVLTHNHQDHVLLETLLQLRPFIRTSSSRAQAQASFRTRASSSS